MESSPKPLPALCALAAALLLFVLPIMSSTEPQPKSRAVKKVKEPKAKVVDVSWKLYEAVIDETIARIKPEFVQDGVDE